jgi:hypothetical protein
MPYLVVTSCYPSHIAVEVAQKYLEAMQAVPDDENLSSTVVPVAVTTTTDGIKPMSIAELKPGKLEEALELARKRMVMFHEIEGFEYTIEVQSTVAEALADIGMSMPE